MTTYSISSILAWRSPWTEEPGGLQSTGLQRIVRGCACTHMHRHIHTHTHTHTQILKTHVKYSGEDYSSL